MLLGVFLSFVLQTDQAQANEKTDRIILNESDANQPMVQKMESEDVENNKQPVNNEGNEVVVNMENDDSKGLGNEKVHENKRNGIEQDVKLSNKNENTEKVATKNDVNDVIHADRNSGNGKHELNNNQRNYNQQTGDTQENEFDNTNLNTHYVNSRDREKTFKRDVIENKIKNEYGDFLGEGITITNDDISYILNKAKIDYGKQSLQEIEQSVLKIALEYFKEKSDFYKTLGTTRQRDNEFEGIMPRSAFRNFGPSAPGLWLQPKNVNPRPNVRPKPPKTVKPKLPARVPQGNRPVSYTHLTLPTNVSMCRSRWSPYH